MEPVVQKQAVSAPSTAKPKPKPALFGDDDDDDDEESDDGGNAFLFRRPGA